MSPVIYLTWVALAALNRCRISKFRAQTTNHINQRGKRGKRKGKEGNEEWRMRAYLLNIVCLEPELIELVLRLLTDGPDILHCLHVFQYLVERFLDASSDPATVPLPTHAP